MLNPRCPLDTQRAQSGGAASYMRLKFSEEDKYSDLDLGVSLQFVIKSTESILGSKHGKQLQNN
jgi:hypothetical protein